MNHLGIESEKKNQFQVYNMIKLTDLADRSL